MVCVAYNETIVYHIVAYSYYSAAPAPWIGVPEREWSELRVLPLTVHGVEFIEYSLKSCKLQTPDRLTLAPSRIDEERLTLSNTTAPSI